MSVIEKLQAVAKDVITKEPCVNEGGCCVYASIVGEKLEQLGYEVRVVTCGSKGKNRNTGKVISPFRAEMEYDVDFFHVGLVVKVNGRWYNHDADFTGKGAKKFGGVFEAAGTYFTVQQAKRFAKERDFWNDSFRRKPGIANIRKIVNKHFSN